MKNKCRAYKDNEEDLHERSMEKYKNQKQDFANESKKIKFSMLNKIKKIADEQKDKNQKRAFLMKMEKTFSMIKRNKQNESSCPSLMLKKTMTLNKSNAN